MTLSVDDASQETIQALVREVKDLRETVEEQGETIDQQANRIDQLETEVAKHKDHTGREFADVRSRVTEVEETLEDGGIPSSEPEPGTGGGKTPLERISTTPEHQVDQLGLTANQERARFIAKDIRDYAEKVPAGLVVDSRTVKKVIAAKEGNRPHNQTVARIMDFLDDFGQDDVDMVKRRGRNLIVMDPDAADRLMACNDRCDGASGPTPPGTVTSPG